MLTEQRKQFIEEYLRTRCSNATAAAKAAGYSPRTAHTQASDILKDTEVREYLEKRKAEIRQVLQDEFLYDAQEAKKVMYDILKDKEAKDADRLTVAKDFLDRAGFKPVDKSKMEVDTVITVNIDYDYGD